MLTSLMKKTLDFIGGRISDTGISPSYDEIRAAVGIKSKSNVHRLVLALEQRGFIERIPMFSRSIRLRSQSASPALLALLKAYKEERQELVNAFPEIFDHPSDVPDPEVASLAAKLAKMDRIIEDAERALA